MSDRPHWLLGVQDKLYMGKLDTKTVRLGGYASDLWAMRLDVASKNLPGKIYA